MADAGSALQQAYLDYFGHSPTDADLAQYGWNKDYNPWNPFSLRIDTGQDPAFWQNIDTGADQDRLTQALWDRLAGESINEASAPTYAQQHPSTAPGQTQDSSAPVAPSAPTAPSDTHQTPTSTPGSSGGVIGGVSSGTDAPLLSSTSAAAYGLPSAAGNPAGTTSSIASNLAALGSASNAGLTDLQSTYNTGLRSAVSQLGAPQTGTTPATGAYAQMNPMKTSDGSDWAKAMAALGGSGANVSSPDVSGAAANLGSAGTTASNTGLDLTPEAGALQAILNQSLQAGGLSPSQTPTVAASAPSVAARTNPSASAPATARSDMAPSTPYSPSTRAPAPASTFTPNLAGAPPPLQVQNIAPVALGYQITPGTIHDAPPVPTTVGNTSLGLIAPTPTLGDGGGQAQAGAPGAGSFWTGSGPAGPGGGHPGGTASAGAPTAPPAAIPAATAQSLTAGGGVESGHPTAMGKSTWHPQTISALKAADMAGPVPAGTQSSAATSTTPHSQALQPAARTIMGGGVERAPTRATPTGTTWAPPQAMGAGSIVPRTAAAAPAAAPSGGGSLHAMADWPHLGETVSTAAAAGTTNQLTPDVRDVIGGLRSQALQTPPNPYDVNSAAFQNNLAAQEANVQRAMAGQQANLSGALAGRGMLGGGTEAAMRAQLGGAQGAEMGAVASKAYEDAYNNAAQYGLSEQGLQQSALGQLGQMEQVNPEFASRQRTQQAALAEQLASQSQAAAQFGLQKAQTLGELAQQQAQIAQIDPEFALRQQAQQAAIAGQQAQLAQIPFEQGLQSAQLQGNLAAQQAAMAQQALQGGLDVANYQSGLQQAAGNLALQQGQQAQQQQNIGLAAQQQAFDEWLKNNQYASASQAQAWEEQNAPGLAALGLGSQLLGSLGGALITHAGGK